MRYILITLFTGCNNQQIINTLQVNIFFLETKNMFLLSFNINAKIHFRTGKASKTNGFVYVFRINKVRNYFPGWKWVKMLLLTKHCVQ